MLILTSDIFHCPTASGWRTARNRVECFKVKGYLLEPPLIFDFQILWMTKCQIRQFINLVDIAIWQFCGSFFHKHAHTLKTSFVNFVIDFPQNLHFLILLSNQSKIVFFSSFVNFTAKSSFTNFILTLFKKPPQPVCDWLVTTHYLYLPFELKH